MSITTSREQRRQLARENAKWPSALVEIPRSQWPNPDGPQLRVLRSREFLVQEFPADGMALARLSVNITAMDSDRWRDGIPWEDLQRLKAEAGYPMHDAVEVYPRAVDVVNVANMRHIWIMRDALPFAWRKRQPQE